MTDRAPAEAERGASGADAAPLPMRRTGQAERYVLQAAGLRRRQLRAAVLYGSARSWRQRQPLWIAAMIGVIAAAVIVAAIAVANAFEKQRQADAEREASQSVQAPALIGS
ncbi:hypothetical protein [Glycomyces salinus]|uniref:hypothetical protein n=1 Tax=Glycomyces salinus TaxID=980294 RepID=UPI0018EA71F5|nr:hypothetical protein [Glycomyces salinus]